MQLVGQGEQLIADAIREEVQLLAADEGDREQMRVIREQMVELAPPPAG
ncbi:MAG: hypothetical protein ACR2HC_06960 [Thermoleophilaceae bacterium]